jgi:[ribosomal protein S5]-alanine N-acetyltransferase
MIQVAEDLFLSEVRVSDRDRYVDYLQDIEIYNNTLQIPHPYTTADADFWIALNEEWRRRDTRLTSFAIRNREGLLLGNAGFHDLAINKTHKAEIGYWLAKRFWGKGIMTSVVGKLVELGVKEFNLKRLTATVFVGNEASTRCLEKNGFICEGRLKNYYLKDGMLKDAMLYAFCPEN